LDFRCWEWNVGCDSIEEKRQFKIIVAVALIQERSGNIIDSVLRCNFDDGSQLATLFRTAYGAYFHGSS
jgi:hypothetical protein